MEIRQTVRNGMPIINGIWYVEQQAVMRYRIWDTPAGRRLTPMKQPERPMFGQRYLFLWQSEILFPEMNGTLRFGRLRDPQCGCLYFLDSQTEAVIWVASFGYAAPFVKGTRYGSRVMLATNDGELWQVTLKTPLDVDFTIMSQSGLIQHIK
ncbi:MAG: hypothetical protein IK130_08815 [Oscillospiraceae bacterium]|nr:hypothetical protein [Oscillospiraceae bacterium]